MWQDQALENLCYIQIMLLFTLYKNRILLVWVWLMTYYVTNEEKGLVVLQHFCGSHDMGVGPSLRKQINCLKELLIT